MLIPKKDWGDHALYSFVQPIEKWLEVVAVSAYRRRMADRLPGKLACNESIRWFITSMPDD